MNRGADAEGVVHTGAADAAARGHIPRTASVIGRRRAEPGNVCIKPVRGHANQITRRRSSVIVIIILDIFVIFPIGMCALVISQIPCTPCPVAFIPTDLAYRRQPYFRIVRHNGADIIIVINAA